MLYLEYNNASYLNNLLYGVDDPLNGYDGFNSYLNIDYRDFFKDYFNIYTAKSDGLNNWGRILGISRNIYVPSYPYFFGFNSSTNPFPVIANSGTQSFNYGGFNSGATTYTPVNDNTFRAMLLMRYQTLISNMSILSITDILNTFFINLNNFTGGGINTQWVSVQDNVTKMQIDYTFTEPLTIWQRQILYPKSLTTLLPKPLGVKAIIHQPT